MTSGAVTADGCACVLADGSQMPMPGPGVWQVPSGAGEFGEEGLPWRRRGPRSAGVPASVESMTANSCLP